MGDVMQEWALVAGEPRHVSDFADLAPKDRPRGVCLECSEPVIFKCGALVSHHVAHRTSNDECEAAKGEGAEHYNAKLYLASVLRQGRTLVAHQPCAKCGSPNAAEPLTVEYDEVRLEYCHPNRLRADIALLMDGWARCAVEVYVSHRCEYEKVAFHRQTGLLCVEVWAEHAQGWRPPSPMRASAVYGVESWVCSSCAERASMEAEARRLGRLLHPSLSAPAEAEAPRRPIFGGQRRDIALQKIFFASPPEGYPFKQTFITIEYVEYDAGGESTHKQLLVWDEGRIHKVLSEAYPPYTELQSERFRGAYKDYLEELEALYGSFRRGRWMRFVGTRLEPPGS